jgi:hypothetical protein
MTGLRRAEADIVILCSESINPADCHDRFERFADARGVDRKEQMSCGRLFAALEHDG